jgi:hypothetical protein
MQTRIKFVRYGHNTALGNFAPGDLAWCDESMARHLVEQVGCAQYAQPAAPPVSTPAESKPRHRSRRPRPEALPL